MKLGRFDIFSGGVGTAFLGIGWAVADMSPAVSGICFALGGAALGAVIGRLMTPPPEESAWIDAAISSYRQVGSTIRSLERFRDECLPDCKAEQKEAIVEFCRQTKHSLTTCIDQLGNVQEDWRDFVAANCLECGVYMKRMDEADHVRLPTARTSDAAQ